PDTPSNTLSPQSAIGLPPETGASDSPAEIGDSISAQELVDSIHLIWDDDGSPDGVIALLYLLKHPNIDVRAITVSCGEAHPAVFAENLTRMLARIEQEGIPVAAGRETPLEGDNAFPDTWRASSDTFWGIALPPAAEPLVSESAAEVVNTVLQHSMEPVTIFISGNHTNIAELLRLNPDIKSRVERFEIMGGALYVPGNIASDWPENPNQVAEWNIWVDPAAAEEIFSSGIRIQLMPLDATKHVVWTEQDAAAWEESGSPEGVLAAEILRWMLASWYPEGVFAWDLMAAVDLTNPDLCLHSNVHIRVNTQQGMEQGQTIVEDDHPSNTSACIKPSAEEIKEQVISVFQNP
ncbi:MAG: nucleoside hydrolase, partial [Anaerolineales bacterium]|nr:nucleoside hydrolase [Anaerolineales bacterium]